MYLSYAHDYFWGYAGGFPMRGPVFPLWIAFWHLLGVPLRLVTEFGFLASAAAFCASLLRARVPRAIGALAFLGIVFHPATVGMLDSPMSEGLTTCFLLLALASFVAMITARTTSSWIVYGFLVGLTSVLSVQSRGVDALLIYCFCACTIGSGVLVSFVRFSRRRAAYQVAGSSLAMIATIVPVEPIRPFRELLRIRIFWGQRRRDSWAEAAIRPLLLRSTLGSLRSIGQSRSQQRLGKSLMFLALHWHILKTQLKRHIVPRRTNART